MELTAEIAILTSKMMEIATVMTHLLHISYIARINRIADAAVQ